MHDFVIFFFGRTISENGFQFRWLNSKEVDAAFAYFGNANFEPSKMKVVPGVNDRLCTETDRDCSVFRSDT